jgi:hypothetical protein
MLKCAVLIKEWAAGGREQVSNGRVDDLLQSLLPRLREYLDHTLMLKDNRHIDRIIHDALGKPPPVRHSTTVCRKCGYSPEIEFPDFDFESEPCPECSGPRKHVMHWVPFVCHLYHLGGVMKGLTENPELATALLDHLSGIQPKSSSLSSQRYLYYRAILKDPRDVVFALHYDGFAPFGTRADYYSMGYLLLQAKIGPATGVKAAHIGLWCIFDGPHHLKTLQPILHILMQQIKECWQDGVTSVWPISIAGFNPGEFQQRCIIGSICADSPALCLLAGSSLATAKYSCR